MLHRSRDILLFPSCLQTLTTYFKSANHILLPQYCTALHTQSWDHKVLHWLEPFVVQGAATTEALMGPSGSISEMQPKRLQLLIFQAENKPLSFTSCLAFLPCFTSSLFAESPTSHSSGPACKKAETTILICCTFGSSFSFSRGALLLPAVKGAQ